MNSLKKYRISLGLSQQELALATGVPRYVIQLAETGTKLPTLEHQKLLNDLFGKDIFCVAKGGASENQ